MIVLVMLTVSWSKVVVGGGFCLGKRSLFYVMSNTGQRSKRMENDKRQGFESRLKILSDIYIWDIPSAVLIFTENGNRFKKQFHHVLCSGYIFTFISESEQYRTCSCDSPKQTFCFLLSVICKYFLFALSNTFVAVEYLKCS